MKRLLLLLCLSLPLLVGTLWLTKPQAPSPSYDVLVVGSEPEGVMAAVAAAEEGARTLLVTEDSRVGGLFVLGGLNTLDLRTNPLVQRGLFERWWRRVGRGSAFDVARAEAAFNDMLSVAGVEVRLGVTGLEPLIRKAHVVGAQTAGETFYARQVIDATAEGDFAAAAGVPYTLGFASLGLDARMADTLVFRLRGVDWHELALASRERGAAYAQINAHAAWGHFGGYPADYRAQETGLRLRGLNLGRQDDGSVLVNALLIYGLEPPSAASLSAGVARAKRELPRIVEYLRALPGLERATLDGAAEQLYLRETRHFETRCTLSVDDTLGNVVRPDDVAAGNYPLDVQTLTPGDDGYVYGVPELYGARLCVALPQGVENLWLVGKTAGYDPLAASSARVVPFGMALAEAVGVASAQATLGRLPSRTYATSGDAVQRVRVRLAARGAYLPEVRVRTPTGPVDHPHFEAYRTLRRKGLALGGYSNDPRLDEEMSALGFLYLLANVSERFWLDAALGNQLVASFPRLSGNLTPDLAAKLFRSASCALGKCLEARLLDRFGNGALTRGEAYALAARLARVGEKGQKAQARAAEE